MSELSNITSDIDIQRPELWNMVLRLDADKIKFILYSDSVDNSLISREIKIDNINPNGYLQALENSVYDNPVLLMDYNKVTVEVTSMRFLLLPPEWEITDDYDKEPTPGFRFVYAQGNGDVCYNKFDKCNVTVEYEMSRGLLSFLQRTFNNPFICHHTLPVCEYFKGISDKIGVDSMMVYVHDGRLDVAVYEKSGHLMRVNTFTYHSADDAVFYILGLWNRMGLDVMEAQLHLAGDMDAREQMTPILREYVSYVLPMEFPAAAQKIGDDAIKAPFDLILLSQCE